MVWHEWTNSSLDLLQRCAEAFRRRYLERERLPSTPAQIRGRVIHRVIGRLLDRKRRTGANPDPEEARDLAACEFEAAWRGGVRISDAERKLGLKILGGQTKDFAVGASGFHAERVAPDITPVAVEHRIIIKPKDTALIIHGTIDLIDGTAHGERIRDTKSATRKARQNAADSSQQLTLYSLIRRVERQAATGIEMPLVPLRLDYLVRTPKQGRLSHQHFDTTRSAADVDALLWRLDMAARAVEAGIFVPTTATNWYCHKDYCEYWTTCRYTFKGHHRPRT